MNATPVIKGWCPGALTPMESGDGLVVRVRPLNGRLSAQQATGIATLSTKYGNGLLDISTRANIQIRGVTQNALTALTDGLNELALLDPTPESEARRNVIVTPFWDLSDQTETLANELNAALTATDALQTPSKFGFAIDTGPEPLLQDAPADIRLERSSDGNLLLVANGSMTGKPVTPQIAIAEATALTHWFMNTRQSHNRMAKLLAAGVELPTGHTTPRQNQQTPPAPGVTAHGALFGVAFGQLRSDTLAELAAHGPLRLTPWRMILMETNNPIPAIDGLITDPNDPLLNIVACTGAPGCSQGLVETRSLARTLANQLAKGQSIHISGCAKGCAHPKTAPLTITGTTQGLSLIRNGRADDTPYKSGLTADQLIKAI